MASGADIRTLVSELQNALNRHQFEAISDLLSRAKRALLLQNALIPTPSTSPELVSAAREILEVGALASIRQTDAPTFTRYYQQLQPFYDLERDSTGAGKVDFKTSQRSKVTGLYLLLLLSMGDSTSFHTVLEGLVEEASLKGKSVEDDPFIKYPVELERNLMEGSYDKVWRETNSERVPSEEFALFSSVSALFLSFFLFMFFSFNFSLFYFPPHPPLHLICEMRMMLTTTGPGWNHPQRDRRLLRKSVPVAPHLQRQEPPIPRVRRGRHRVRSAARVGAA